MVYIHLYMIYDVYRYYYETRGKEIQNIFLLLKSYDR